MKKLILSVVLGLFASTIALADIAKPEKPKDEKPDPLRAANLRLVNSEARAQLAALGITDKSEQKTVIGYLNLGDVSVDDDGDVDTDEIEERISALQKIFGGKSQRRRPPRTDPRDRSGGGSGPTNSDPDSARYARILGKR